MKNDRDPNLPTKEVSYSGGRLGTERFKIRSEADSRLQRARPGPQDLTRAWGPFKPKRVHPRPERAHTRIGGVGVGGHSKLKRDHLRPERASLKITWEHMTNKA